MKVINFEINILIKINYNFSYKNSILIKNYNNFYFI